MISIPGISCSIPKYIVFFAIIYIIWYVLLNIFAKWAMITYKSKIVSYAALILLVYLLFQKYTEYKNKPKYLSQANAFEDISSNTKTKYTIKIDEKKKYEDYNLLEKGIYYFIKDDLPKSARNSIESSKPTEKKP